MQAKPSSTLYYESFGSHNKPVLLFFHGFMGSSVEWKPLALKLSNQYYCIIVDLPGHGQSICFEHQEDYSIDHMNQMLCNLLDVLSVNRASLVGYSMGGRLALAFMKAFPERVDQLIIESASIGIYDETERQNRRMIDETLAHQIENTELDAFLNTWYSQPLFKSLVSNKVLFKQILKIRIMNDRGELAKALRGMGVSQHGCFRDALNHFPRPLLWVTGLADNKYSQLYKSYVDQFDCSTLELMPNAGHNTHLEYPNEFLNVLKGFLSTKR